MVKSSLQDWHTPETLAAIVADFRMILDPSKAIEQPLPPEGVVYKSQVTVAFDPYDYLEKIREWYPKTALQSAAKLLTQAEQQQLRSML